MPLTGAVGTQASISAEVSKAVFVPLAGYRAAVQRLRDAHSRSDADGVYIALTEAANWLAGLAEKSQTLSGDSDVRAVVFARNRSHHHWASLTYPDDDGVHRWRPASQLPIPDERYADPNREADYVQQLQGKPVLDTFGRIDAAIARGL